MKFLVTFQMMGEVQTHMFGSSRGVAEFLRRHPLLVTTEERQLQVLEIGRECSLKEFFNEAVAA